MANEAATTEKPKTAKFKYVGDPNDGFKGPDRNTMHGLVFIKGEVTEVPTDLMDRTGAMKVVSRLKANDHFVDMSDKADVKDDAERAKAAEKAEADAAAAAKKESDAADKEAKAQRERDVAAAQAANRTNRDR